MDYLRLSAGELKLKLMSNKYIWRIIEMEESITIKHREAGNKMTRA
jgi:hypothetical protein